MSLLTADECAELIQIAREAVRRRVFCNQSYRPRPAHQALYENRGAFVTLKRMGELRGCLGRLSASLPLYIAVSECASAAASEDERFDPVTPEEFNQIEFAVSVLTPLQAVDDTNRIEVGTHGLFIEKDGLNGVLLPQVASELKLDRERFLQLTCRKAGLPEDAWQDGAAIWSFTAQVIHSGLL